MTDVLLKCIHVEFSEGNLIKVTTNIDNRLELEINSEVGVTLNKEDILGLIKMLVQGYAELE